MQALALSSPRPRRILSWNSIERGHGPYEEWKQDITACLASDLETGHAWGIKLRLGTALGPARKPKGYNWEEVRDACVDTINQSLIALITSKKIHTALWDIEVLCEGYAPRRTKDFVQRVRPEIITALVASLGDPDLKDNGKTIPLSRRAYYVFELAKRMEERGPVLEGAFLMGFSLLPDDIQAQASLRATIEAVNLRRDLLGMAAGCETDAAKPRNKRLAGNLLQSAQEYRERAQKMCEPVFDRLTRPKGPLLLTGPQLNS